jgi:hypothetical protein
MHYKGTSKTVPEIYCVALTQAACTTKPSHTNKPSFRGRQTDFSPNRIPATQFRGRTRWEAREVERLAHPVSISTITTMLAATGTVPVGAAELPIRAWVLLSDAGDERTDSSLLGSMHRIAQRVNPSRSSGRTSISTTGKSGLTDQSFTKWWASAKRRLRRSLCHFTLFWPKSCRIGIGTRTPDLYRVNAHLFNPSNNLHHAQTLGGTRKTVVRWIEERIGLH